MVVNITINGSYVCKEELKNIVIKNDAISDLIQKVAKRQNEFTQNKKVKSA